MEKKSALLAFCEGISSLTGEFSSQRPVTQSFDVFAFLICAWTNDWVNNRVAHDFRRHRTHYDAIVMNFPNNEKSHYLAHVFISGCIPQSVQWRP